MITFRAQMKMLVLTIAVTALAPLTAHAAIQSSKSGQSDGWVTEFSRHVGPFHETTWWNDNEGHPLGAIERDSWKQIFRSRFIYKDEFGDRRAEGIQPWSLGVLVPSMAKLRIIDQHGRPLAFVRGKFITASASRFKICNAQNMHVADAWMDSTGQSIAFSHPSGQAARFASLVHLQGGADSTRWRLQVATSDVVEDAAWPILGAFFAMKFEGFEANKKQEEQNRQESTQRRIYREEHGRARQGAEFDLADFLR